VEEVVFLTVRFHGGKDFSNVFNVSTKFSNILNHTFKSEHITKKGFNGAFQRYKDVYVSSSNGWEKLVLTKSKQKSVLWCFAKISHVKTQLPIPHSLL
jgi:hypothetical protein